MNTFSSKLGALAAALMMNGLLMAAVAYLFELQAPPNSAVAFVVQAAAHRWLG